MRSLVTGVRTAMLFVFLCVGSAPASADWLLVPFVGSTFGGAANFGDIGDFEDNFEKKVTFGGTATWMGAGVIGFELDFGVTPNFFEVTTGLGDFEFGDTNVTTLMGNLVVGVPIGGTRGPGVRPYGTGGIGLFRSRISAGALFDDLSTNELGVNVGGGVHVFFTDNVGVRGDVRYFRALDQGDEGLLDLIDLDFVDFDFWRATVGVAFRF
jgi:opacity protein-like surface antigen